MNASPGTRAVTRLALLALLLAPAAAAAQIGAPAGPPAGDPVLFGIGYAANAPDLMVGGAVWGLVPGLRGWGLYADAKLDPGDPSADDFFVAGLSPGQIDVQYPDDEEFAQEDRWRSFNVAVVRVVTPELMLYGGGGYATRDVYRQYLDPSRSRGNFGFYWVEDADASTTELNLMVGALLRVSSRLRLQFGGETAPRGFTVGASLVFGGR